MYYQKQATLVYCACGVPLAVQNKNDCWQPQPVFVSHSYSTYNQSPIDMERICHPQACDCGAVVVCA